MHRPAHRFGIFQPVDYFTVSCAVTEWESDPDAALTVNDRFCGENFALPQPVNPVASAALTAASTAGLTNCARPLRNLPANGNRMNPNATNRNPLPSDPRGRSSAALAGSVS
jgi:hypothetical protein